MNDSFDVKEVMSSFKKWREQTTTGGRHLGHYKAWLMKHAEDEDSIENEEFLRC